MGGLLALALLMATPSNQTLVYYNARMALRDGQPVEALKLWLLRNTLETETRQVSGHDGDFRSVTWAAIGDLGLCPDGLVPDVAGAGLYPLAQHNYLVHAMRRPEPADSGEPFDAFEHGRQQRRVSLNDVLDAEELATVQFQRTPCWLHAVLARETREALWGAKVSDKPLTGRLMRHLLRIALRTLHPERVRGLSVVQARIFDLNLRLTGLGAGAAARAKRALRVEAQRSGLSPAELADRERELTAVDPESEEGRILAAALAWSADDWMALSSLRRQFLVSEVLRQEGAAERMRPVVLEVVDRLIDARQGAELQSWLARLGDTPEDRHPVWSGERGQRLMALDPKTGFRERGVIALHRGVADLAAGSLPAAIRTFAFALRTAEDSRAATETRDLSRRWLSFVAAQFQVTDELLGMLKVTVPRGEYAAVLEDQLWHATFAADAESFERCVRHRVGRGALNRRIELLAPLARGDAGAFVDRLGTQLDESPSSALRFIDLFVERLQSQDAGTRARMAPTLRRIVGLLDREDAASKRSERRVEGLVAEIQGVLEGLPEGTEMGPLRAMAVDRAVFAGSVRVAPSDPLPWPFEVADVQAPSAFEPITLRPEEWRGADGAWVFGWRVLD